MRVVRGAVVVFAVVAAAGCTSGRAADPVKLVPDSATMIAGVDVGGLLASPSYTRAKEKVAQLQTFEKGLADIEACKLDPKRMKFVLGGNERRQFVVVLSGPGVGVKENVECLAKRSETSMHSQPVTFEEKEGWSTVEIDGGAQIGILVNDDLLVISERSWVGDVKALIEKKDGAKGCVDGTLAGPFAVTDADKMLWFAGQVPRDLAEQAPVGAGSTGAGGWMDFADGAKVEVTAIFADAATATKTAADAKSALESAKPLVDLVGLPPEVKSAIDAVKITAVEEKVTVHAEVSQKDLDLTMDKAVALMGGGQ